MLPGLGAGEQRPHHRIGHHRPDQPELRGIPSRIDPVGQQDDDDSRSGSIQIEVPVKPVWPKLRDDMIVPAEETPDGVSHPMARDEPAG